MNTRSTGSFSQHRFVLIGNSRDPSANYFLPHRDVRVHRDFGMGVAEEQAFNQEFSSVG